MWGTFPSRGAVIDGMGTLSKGAQVLYTLPRAGVHKGRIAVGSWLWLCKRCQAMEEPRSHALPTSAVAAERGRFAHAFPAITTSIETCVLDAGNVPCQVLA